MCSSTRYATTNAADSCRAHPGQRRGYRQYPPDTVRRVTFIKRAQALGFTLEEIGGPLSLRVTPGHSCTTVEGQARSAIARLDGQLAELQRMRLALARLADACHSQPADGECPLLDAIEPQEENGTDELSTD